MQKILSLNKTDADLLISQRGYKSEAENRKQTENLSEIFNRLSQMGYTLDLFDQKDKEALYGIKQAFIYLFH